MRRLVWCSAVVSVLGVSRAQMIRVAVADLVASRASG